MCVSLEAGTFQLTRPMRGVTDAALSCFRSLSFQLTRPMRGVTGAQGQGIRQEDISTHTPHAGRDLVVFCFASHADVISTHTPHAGRD